MQARMKRSFGASPTESCNLLSLLPVGVGDDLGLGNGLWLWRRSGRGSPQRRGLGPRPPPALEYQEQSEYNHYDQRRDEEGLDRALVVDAAVLLRVPRVSGPIDARDSLTSTSYVFLNKNTTDLVSFCQMRGLEPKKSA